MPSRMIGLLPSGEEVPLQLSWSCNGGENMQSRQAGQRMGQVVTDGAL